MALSMEEQRILAEIEQELVRSEPMLAACLTMFSRPGRNVLLRPSRPSPARSPFLLAAASLAALIMLTVMPVVVFALVALHGAQGAPGHPAPPGHAAARQITNVPR